MAKAEPDESPGTVLPWDSEFFGFRIGRLATSRLTPGSLRATLAWAAAEKLRCAYFFAQADDAETLVLAHEGGFRFVDMRMELAVDLPAALDRPASPVLRAAVAADLPDLEALARISHDDTRFFKDPAFPADRSAELYAAWIRRDFQRHRILVATDESGHIAGYVTCQTENAPAIGRIGLIAVAETARRRGLGRALVTGALQWFHGEGLRHVRVVTQASNVPAQRVYQSLGFRTAETGATFHRWFDPS